MIPAVMLAGAALMFFAPRLLAAGEETTVSQYRTYTVERRDVTETLEGSGPLQPADSYTVTSLIEGEILTADFEEGDVVEEDTILYSVDSSDAATSIERAELTLTESRRTYEARLRDQADLTVLSTATGVISDMAVDIGDSVTAGQVIATVRDSEVLKITLPFASHAAAGFTVGQPARLTLTSTDIVLEGTVSEIDGADRYHEGNFVTRDVTIELNNPGALSTTQTASAVIGSEESLESGTFTYRELESIASRVSGEISAILAPVGTKVRQNQAILQLTSESIEDNVANAADNVRDAELALANQKENEDSYQISSPIQGTIVEKSYKEGDTLEAGETLCTIYDLSYLEMSLSVDELDIGKVAVGQEVTLTAAAVPDREYAGVVTRININGSTTGSVTTYPVTIRIDETEGLLPGMNVDANIVVHEVPAALTVPADALKRGDVVLLQSASDAAGANESNTAVVDGVPSGYVETLVTTGANDGDYIEILDGLDEGDVIAYMPKQFESISFREQMRTGPGGSADAPRMVP